MAEQLIPELVTPHIINNIIYDKLRTHPSIKSARALGKAIGITNESLMSYYFSVKRTWNPEKLTKVSKVLKINENLLFSHTTRYFVNILIQDVFSNAFEGQVFTNLKTDDRYYSAVYIKNINTTLYYDIHLNEMKESKANSIERGCNELYVDFVITANGVELHQVAGESEKYEQIKGIIPIYLLSKLLNDAILPAFKSQKITTLKPQKPKVVTRSAGTPSTTTQD